MRSWKKRACRLLPFTISGWIFFLLSLAVTAVGVYRIELAALFWGSGFLFLVLYAALGSAVACRSVRRAIRGQDPARISRFSQSGVFAGETAELSVSLHLPRIRVPGFRYRFLLSLGWENRESVSIRHVLGPGNNDAGLQLRFPFRGKYHGSAGAVFIGDALKFTRQHITLPGSHEISVYPVPEEQGEVRVLSARGGELAGRSRMRVRTDTLLETRKYVPGDDLRRLNWKQYAHSGELFLRIGEEIPPPESSVVCILDSSRSPEIGENIAADYLDRLVSLFAGICFSFLYRDVQVRYQITGQRAGGLLHQERPEEFLRQLAEASWAQSAQVTLPESKGYSVLIVTSPDAPLFAQLVSMAHHRGMRAGALLVDATMPSQDGFHGSGLLRWLFLSDEHQMSDTRARLLREEAERARAAVSRQLAESTASKQGLEYVSRI